MALIGIRAGLQRRALRLSPPSLLALTYLVFVAIGAGLLLLPLANTGEVYFLDALFTSMSAVTVTGLTVVDTGTDFTFFGQVVILMLMQLGGLGLITFAVFVLAALGVPLGLGQRLMLREDLNQSSFGDLLRLVKTVFAVAIGCEAAGVRASRLCLRAGSRLVGGALGVGLPRGVGVQQRGLLALVGQPAALRQATPGESRRCRSLHHRRARLRGPERYLAEAPLARDAAPYQDHAGRGPRR